MSESFEACFIPGHAPGAPGDPTGAIVEWRELPLASGGALRYPVLSGEEMGALADRLRAARERVLVERPVAAIVRSIDRAAALLAAPGHLRTLALEWLPPAARMSPPMVELILDRMTADWRTDALEGLIRAELGGVAGALDGFVVDPAGARAVRALGPRLALNFFAGNVPGVAVTAMVRCLLVKGAVIGKTAVDDPVLPVLFARALQEVDPELASCVAVTYWPGGSGAAEEVAIAQADTIVVYGGAETVRAVRARAPADARILEHGPRMSFGFIARDALGGDEAAVGALARDVALAAATFDQHGCVSLHGAFIERGGAVTPRDFAKRVFEKLDALGANLPPGPLLPGESAHIHAERGRAEFAMGGDGVVFASQGTAATVTYAEEPDATPSCLDRFVRLSAVDALEDGVAALAPCAPLLQTAALAAPAERADGLSEALGRAGFTRVTDFASMPWPPASWHHDGASPLAELVRWVDRELGSP